MSLSVSHSAGGLVGAGGCLGSGETALGFGTSFSASASLMANRLAIRSTSSSVMENVIVGMAEFLQRVCKSANIAGGGNTFLLQSGMTPRWQLGLQEMTAAGWRVKYKEREGFRGISWKGTASRGRLNYFASGNSLDDVMRSLLSMSEAMLKSTTQMFSQI